MSAGCVPGLENSLPSQGKFLYRVRKIPCIASAGNCCKSLEAPCKVIRGRIWAEFEKIPAKFAAIREFREQTERQPQSWCLSENSRSAHEVSRPGENLHSLRRWRGRLRVVST